MTKQEKETRIALVKEVRNAFRPHFFKRCLEVAYRVIPCCKNCEFNVAGICNVPPHVYFFENGPFVSGTVIKNCESLCIHWSPSSEAMLHALEYVYNVPATARSAAPQHSGRKLIKIDDRFKEQVRLYHSGKVKAADAANTLGIGLSTFYAKAAKWK